MSDMLDFADRFFGAVSSGDIETVRGIYRDDVQVWHNWDDRVQDKEENLSVLASIPQRYDSFEYLDVRRTPLTDGFLRQHTIAASRNGKSARVPAILRVYVDGGRVYRIEEYFDRGQLESALA
ncbi:ketosteroid isomerase [Nocardia sp. SYP-A9097]|uniref:nuclear transport factor 2 family protein n=1 Tax=Nocardia sp. SYP-A9097 TaxID=2663237 RepID=UPI00129B3D23|nr:ketosteroid isomerase [Nocardia sp. SYP-A9097]MRH91775.1 ketosteroid isomerase [Nocardia sp. SYP-A9097]